MNGELHITGHCVRPKGRIFLFLLESSERLIYEETTT